MIKFPDSNDSINSKVNYSSRAINTLNRTFGVEICLDNKKEYHPNQIAIIKINDYQSAKTCYCNVPLNYYKKI
jgi:membrane fusion protein (multidrug efflux system)